MASWLDKARSIPVGTTARIRHCGMRWGNMVVRNELTRWSAYCFRCKEFMWEEKTHVRHEETASVRNTKDIYSIPKDATKAVPSSIMSIVWKYGLTFDSTISQYELLYSPRMNRLYFFDRDSGEISSRYCGHSAGVPKWIHNTPYSLVPSWETPCVVLTEDLLSAIKVRAAADSAVPWIGAIAVHGTSPGKDIMLAIKSRNTQAVVLAFDGDEAGEYAYNAFRKALKPVVGTVMRMNVPAGMDPKDMSFDVLRHELLMIKGRFEREC